MSGGSERANGRASDPVLYPSIPELFWPTVQRDGVGGGGGRGRLECLDNSMNNAKLEFLQHPMIQRLNNDISWDLMVIELLKQHQVQQ